MVGVVRFGDTVMSNKENKYEVDEIDSDSKLYGRVTEDGVDVTVTERPEIPGVDPLNESNVIQKLRRCECSSFLIGTNRVIGPSWETWIPVTDNLTIGVDDEYRCFTFNNYEFMVRTENNAEPNVPTTDFYVIKKSALISHLSDTAGDGDQLIGDAHPVTTQSDSFNQDRLLYDEDDFPSWVHGTSPTDGHNWEAYVPLEDTAVDIWNPVGSTQIKLKWSDEMILRRYRDDEVNSITERQDGLYVSNLHLMHEDQVPSGSGIASHADDHVRRLDTEADDVGERSSLHSSR
jgi:hypothetical protein